MELKIVAVAKPLNEETIVKRVALSSGDASLLAGGQQFIIDLDAPCESLILTLRKSFIHSCYKATDDLFQDHDSGLIFQCVLHDGAILSAGNGVPVHNSRPGTHMSIEDAYHRLESSVLALKIDGQGQ